MQREHITNCKNNTWKGRMTLPILKRRKCKKVQSHLRRFDKVWHRVVKKILNVWYRGNFTVRNEM